MAVVDSIRMPLFLASPRVGASPVLVLASLVFQTSFAMLHRMGNCSRSSCWVSAAIRSRSITEYVYSMP